MLIMSFLCALFESKLCITFYILFSKRDIWQRFISFEMQERWNFNTVVFDWTLHSQKRNNSAFLKKIVSNLFSWKILHSLFFLADYLLNKHHEIFVHFDNTSVFQSFLKDEAALKIPFVSITSSYNSFSFFIPTTSSLNSFPW